MINLLPDDARTHVLTEYWLRVISVWLLLCVAAGTMVLVLLFPSYILLQLQLQARQDTYQQIEVEQENFAQAQTEIRQTNTKAALLADAADNMLFTDVLNALDAVQAETIFVRSVAVKRVEGVVETVTVQGEATTRDALADFRNRIEATSFFDEAELPLANLARDREVPFSITVTLAQTDI